MAEALLADWPAALARFSAVVPRDYKRVLEATRLAERSGRSVDEAIMEAVSPSGAGTPAAPRPA